MAYMSAEKARTIRNALKERFPDFKFSVRKDRHIALIVTVVSGPLDFSSLPHNGINEFHLDLYEYLGPESHKFLVDVVDTIKTAGDYYDLSDSMSDYFNVAFYFSLYVGGYDAPYVQTPRH